MQITKRLFKLGVLTALATLGIVWSCAICTPYDAVTTHAGTTQLSPQEQQASDFLEAIGFKELQYLGHSARMDGKYRTFQVLTPAGATSFLWVRAYPGDIWELRPADTATASASMDGPAHQAQGVRFYWHTKPVEARLLSADGKVERMRPQVQYNALLSHAPPSCWCILRREVQDWVR
jgi:hypothetical protein